MATGANPKIWTRDAALAVLRELLPELKARYGVERIGVFGSVARNEAGPESDVDVVVHLKRQTLDHLLELKEILDGRFDCDVDLVFFRDSIRPMFKNRLSREAAYAD
ncbi:nucleotidyltransferase [bacterium]|nr:nucleotidyltransferase [bacterium]